VRRLVGELPPAATVGVVTPFRAQADLIKLMLGTDTARVRVGTVHTFQGGECDAMVFSLVATESMDPGGLRFFDRDENLWNVAVTRAKALLLVIGDRAFWDRYGTLGGRLAARIDAVRTQTTQWRHSTEVRDLLYDRLTRIGAKELQLAVSAGGYPLDARLTMEGAMPTGLVLDVHGAEQADAGRVLRQQIRQAELTGAGAAIPVRRLPGWLLYASDEELAAAVTVRPASRRPTWLDTAAVSG
jgi:hypothetical protein